MTLQLVDLVRFNVSGTPGSGAATIGTAPSGYQLPSAAGLAVGNTSPYIGRDGANWEEGLGTLTNSTTWTRTTIYNTSAGNTTPLTLTSNAIFTLTISAEALTAVLAAYSLLSGAAFTGPVSITDASGSDNPILSISATGDANGAGVELLGNGATTPNKYIRAQGGALHILNSAYAAIILTLTDAGLLTIPSLTISGASIAPTATSGTNTTQLATTAFAFGTLSTASNGYQILPSGLILQWGQNGSSTGGTVSVTWPVAFPNGVLSVTANVDGATGATPYLVAIGATSTTAGTFWVTNTTTGVATAAIGFMWMAIGR